MVKKKRVEKAKQIENRERFNIPIPIRCGTKTRKTWQICSGCGKKTRSIRWNNSLNGFVCWNCYKKEFNIIPAPLGNSKRSLSEVLDKVYEVKRYKRKTSRGFTARINLSPILIGHKIKFRLYRKHDIFCGIGKGIPFYDALDRTYTINGRLTKENNIHVNTFSVPQSLINQEVKIELCDKK